MSVVRKKVTMADIADSLGVSKNSVSLALRGMDGVGSELRRLITGRAIQMGYGKVSALATQADASIAIIIPEYLHDDVFFYSEVLRTIGDESASRGVNAIRVEITREMEESIKLPVIPMGLRVIGYLLVGIVSEPYYNVMREMFKPLLSVDIPYSGLPYVGSSNLMGGRAATHFLIEQGHRQIGFIGPIYSAASVYERWCGYSLAMREADLPCENKYNVLGEKTFRLFDSEDVLAPFIEAMDHKFPTAWFCAGDRIAIELIHLLDHMGLRVPDDISVIGFDDLLAAQMVLPRLTTVRIDRKLIGKLAVQYFFDKNEDSAQVSKIVPFELIQRDSVRRCEYAERSV